VSASLALVEAGVTAAAACQWPLASPQRGSESPGRRAGRGPPSVPAGGPGAPSSGSRVFRARGLGRGAPAGSAAPAPSPDQSSEAELPLALAVEAPGPGPGPPGPGPPRRGALVSYRDSDGRICTPSRHSTRGQIPPSVTVQAQSGPYGYSRLRTSQRRSTACASGRSF
jgi:hypothetical protein